MGRPRHKHLDKTLVLLKPRAFQRAFSQNMLEPLGEVVPLLSLWKCLKAQLSISASASHPSLPGPNMPIFLPLYQKNCEARAILKVFYRVVRDGACFARETGAANRDSGIWEKNGRPLHPACNLCQNNAFHAFQGFRLEGRGQDRGAGTASVDGRGGISEDAARKGSLPK